MQQCVRKHILTTSEKLKTIPDLIANKPPKKIPKNTNSQNNNNNNNNTNSQTDTNSQKKIEMKTDTLPTTMEQRMSIMEKQIQELLFITLIQKQNKYYQKQNQFTNLKIYEKIKKKQPPNTLQHLIDLTKIPSPPSNNNNNNSLNKNIPKPKSPQNINELIQLHQQDYLLQDDIIKNKD